MRDKHTLCLGDFGLASFTAYVAPWQLTLPPPFYPSSPSSPPPPSFSHNRKSSGNHGSPNYNPPGMSLSSHLLLFIRSSVY
jgi:hypothetical protein